jgi:hypothetical protein
MHAFASWVCTEAFVHTLPLQQNHACMANCDAPAGTHNCMHTASIKTVVLPSAEMVISYLNQVTEGGCSVLHEELLDEDTATQWLVTFSRCGLEELMQEVQVFVVDHRVQLDESEATSMRQEHLVQLLNTVQTALRDTSTSLNRQLTERNTLILQLTSRTKDLEAQLRAKTPYGYR